MSVKQMDAWLARVLEALDRRRILDETIVVVTSDHGENFGDGGLMAHTGSLDDRLLRVPLVLAGPGVVSAHERIVSTDTIAPLIAQLAGIDHPWEGSSESIAVAQYDGPIDLTDPRATVLRELAVSPERLSRLTRRYTCATDGSIKLVRCEGETVLYDLRSDPLEECPAAVDEALPGVAALVRALDKADAEARDATVQGATDAAMPSDLEERMRLLGYL